MIDSEETTHWTSPEQSLRMMKVVLARTLRWCTQPRIITFCCGDRLRSLMKMRLGIVGSIAEFRVQGTSAGTTSAVEPFGQSHVGGGAIQLPAERPALDWRCFVARRFSLLRPAYAVSIRFEKTSQRGLSSSTSSGILAFLREYPQIAPGRAIIGLALPTDRNIIVTAKLASLVR